MDVALIDQTGMWQQFACVSVPCMLTNAVSGRLHVMWQGTDRDEQHLNIFLEFVPGGSIASLLGKFGVAMPFAFLHDNTMDQAVHHMQIGA